MAGVYRRRFRLRPRSRWLPPSKAAAGGALTIGKAVSLYDTDSNNAADVPYNTASWTPTNGRGYILIVHAAGLGTAARPTVSGNGQTWVFGEESGVGGANYHGWWEVQDASGASSGATSVTFNTGSSMCVIQIYEITGHDTANMVGGSFIGTGSATTTLTMDLTGTTGEAGNGTIASVRQVSSDSAWTSFGGLTNIEDTGMLSPAGRFCMLYDATTLVDPTVVEYTTASNCRGIALEIRKGAGGGPIVRTVADSITFGDSAVRVVTLQRSPSDSLGLSDTATRLLTLFRSASDAATYADSATRAGSTYVRSPSDAVTYADSATRTGTFLRSIAQSLGYADSATRQGTFNRTTSDAATFADAAVGIKLIVRTAADSLGLSDTAVRAVNLLRSASDAAGLSDSAVRVLNLLRSASDAATFADSVVATKSGTVVRTTSDAVTYVDSPTRLLTLFRTATDSATYADAVTRAITKVRSVADAVTHGDVATRTVQLVRSTADAVTASDAASRVVSLLRTAADGVAYADAAVATVSGFLGAGFAGVIRAITDAKLSGSAGDSRLSGSASDSNIDPEEVQ